MRESHLNDMMGYIWEFFFRNSKSVAEEGGHLQIIVFKSNVRKRLVKRKGEKEDFEQ